MAARMYGLFQRDGKRWKRVEGTGAYPKATAVRVFQNRLLASSFGRGPECSLRPIADVKESEVPAEHRLCFRCEGHLHSLCLHGDCNCACRRFQR